MSDVNNLIGSVLDILNNTNNLVDPYNGTRIGSFFFDQEQPMNFTKYMPKGQVTDSNIDDIRYSFGRSKRLKELTINIYFYVFRGDKDFNTEYKDSEFVYDYLEKIENSINSNLGSLSSFRKPTYLATGNIFYDADKRIYSCVKPIMFKKVDST